MPIATIDDVLRRFAVPVTESGCWLWIGATNGCNLGYGAYRVGTRKASQKHLAHRFIWVLVNGPIPDGMCVCHRCDVPSCVNPSHLFLATAGDNNRDRHAKGRSALGNRNGKSKLRAEWIPDIRKSAASDAFLADVYGVTHAAIWHVRKGLNWKHVT